MGRPSFQFVPFGVEAPREAVCCDGLVSGAAIDLSHWPGNSTPSALKRDTSVEIALAYAASGERAELVANNHFDCDGVLAVFCLLEPDLARAHAELLVAAAEVGDFGDWPRSKEAYWLEAAVTTLVGGRAEAAAYERVLPELPALCRSLAAREDLWAEAWSNLEREDARAARDIQIFEVGPVAVFVHAPGAPELPTPVLAKRAPRGATRWLRAFTTRDGRFEYRYELPPYAWADTVARPPLTRPSKNAIVQRVSGAWAIKGDMGMTGLARTRTPSTVDPQCTARELLLGDAWAAACAAQPA